MTIGINKVADLPPPIYFDMDDGKFVCKWFNDDDYDSLELEFFQPELAFRYRFNRNSYHIFASWKIGHEIPDVIASKLKLFVEN